VLKISLRPSWLLAGILVIAHGAAIAVFFLIDVPPWLKAAACAILFGHLVPVVAQRALLLTPGAVVAIEIGSDNRLSVQTRSSAWAEFDVLGTTYVMPYLTVLNLRQNGGRAVKRITLLPDSLHAEDFRKLRAWLRWKEDIPAR
jgi:toxin CptA